ncbi:hypothetical protein KKC59_04565 [bacterium]|nr:hypothetical protein [bacterium]
MIILKINRKISNDFSWIYYPDTNISFQRITDFSYFDEAMVSENCTCLCAEISCFEEEPVFNMSDQDIIERVKKDLIRSNLVVKEDKIEARVIKEKYAYPIQINGYVEVVERILNSLKKYKNLVMTGRQGVYKYCDMNECMEMAIDLEKQMDDDNFLYDLSCKFKGVGVE